jgi:hypothetical protein
MSAILSITSAALLFASSAAGGGNAPSPAASHASPTAKANPAAALPWIEDDYARAAAEAKRRGVPIFVEAWAPW